MTSRDEVARAIAFFESTDDVALLRRLLTEIAPRARREVGRYLRKGGEGAVPPPAEVEPALPAAPEAEAITVIEKTTDFGLLQALSKAIGRRIEALQERNGGHGA
jgi:hypothetical protein